MGLPARKESREILPIDQSEMGKADTLRFNVATYVAEENYEKAIDELKCYLEQDSVYPKLKQKIERYILHAIDLVHAIRAKRKFPGASALTMAKQQELNDRFIAHFSELQYILKKIEKCKEDLKQDDIRSTVWVLRALTYSIFAIVAVAFAMEVSNGLFHTALLVVDDVFLGLTKWLFATLKL